MFSWEWTINCVCVFFLLLKSAQLTWRASALGYNCGTGGFRRSSPPSSPAAWGASALREDCALLSVSTNPAQRASSRRASEMAAGENIKIQRAWREG
eukprot:7130382-Pyramimonas_sp.AAC.1